MRARITPRVVKPEGHEDPTGGSVPGDIDTPEGYEAPSLASLVVEADKPEGHEQ